VGSNPARGMDVCLYSVFVMSKESYQPSISVRLRNLIKRRPSLDMGCSAI
jgi:hypothetical protein